MNDLIALALRWEAQMRRGEEFPVPVRSQRVMEPLPSSRALLKSLGIVSPQSARVPVTSILRRNS
jgi:hypothetical protein